MLYGTLAVLALAYLLPAYMMVVTALKMPENISLPRSWHPPVPSSTGPVFRRLSALLKPNFVNSIVLTIFATILSTVLGSINGYVFSKWKFKGSEVVFTLFLFGMFIPYQVILIPLFQTLRAINLYGGLPGLILAHVVYGLPITTLIFRNFYAQIPDALMESAHAGRRRFFFHLCKDRLSRFPYRALWSRVSGSSLRSGTSFCGVSP